jgi:hypothetical protein
MREIRTSGSEGGGAEPNRRSLPLLSQPWAPAFAGVDLNKTNDLHPRAYRMGEVGLASPDNTL